MDPDANLQEQRETRARMREIENLADMERSHEYTHLAMRLNELSKALDEWITNGGFVPKAWALAYTPISTDGIL